MNGSFNSQRVENHCSKDKNVKTATLWEALYCFISKNAHVLGQARMGGGCQATEKKSSLLECCWTKQSMK